MTPEQVVAQAESLGIQLRAEQGRLRVNAPKGAITEQLKDALSTHKDALVALLERREAAQQARIVRLDRARPLPVSPFQERLWILQRIDPASTAFNMASVWTLQGVGSGDRVVDALRGMLDRHELLRCVFVEHEGGVACRLQQASAVPITVEDARGHEGEALERHIRAALAAALAQPFDLSAAPPVRIIVFRMGEADYAVTFVAHHIAVDAWSMGLLERELSSVLMRGEVAPTPALQYADYAGWQRVSQDPAVLAGDLEWWARYLDGAPAVSVFPPDRLAAGRPAGATRTYVWSADLCSRLSALAKREGTTLYIMMIAAAAAVLRWHTRQSDVVFGSPMGVRERPELEPIVGPFVNLLLVRLSLADDPDFQTLLRRARDAFLDAHAHRHVPFELLLERLKPPRSFDHSPLFQLAIVHHNAPADSSTGGHSGGAMHELTWFARETADHSLECSFEYRSDLYTQAAIDRIAAHLCLLLERASRSPTARLGELCVLADAERSKVLTEFNDTAVAVGPELFPQRFERLAAAWPNDIALQYGDQRVSYAELDRRANQVAHRLVALGVGRGSLAGVCLERSPLLLVALLAIQKAGAAYVPLDPGFPVERLSFMVADSRVKVILTADDAAGGIDIPAGVTVVDLASDAALAGQPTTSLGPRAQAQDPAYVIYTSGSTGRPKGVVVPHGALMNFLDSMQRQPGMERSDVLAAVTTISFDIAALELYLPLLVGARIVLVPREVAADGRDLATLLSDSGATMLQATPATWRMLIEAGWEGHASFRGLCGGEALRRDLANALLTRTGELWNLYGPTETTVWSTAARVEGGDTAPVIGRPIANTQVYLRDPAGELVPIGIPGEIWIGGDGVALGYHHRPELTAERFVPDPYSTRPGARLYRTGDLGRWREDGVLEHLGRLDHQVKIRGFRIELGEIETVLATHEAIRQSVVVAREAAPGDMRLVAYVVYQPGEDLTVSDVRRHLRAELPDYMIPSLVVPIDAIPLTPNGKVDRAALPDPFRMRAAGGTEYVAPETGLERTLAAIWEEVLKIERVGANDNFFELGGHSLLSLRVAAAVEKSSGWRMDPRLLFFQTLSQIAAAGNAALGAAQRRA